MRGQVAASQPAVPGIEAYDQDAITKKAHSMGLYEAITPMSTLKYAVVKGF